MARKRRSGKTSSGTAHNTHIISNMAYIKHPKEMLGKLRYFQYRDDKHDHIHHRRGQMRPRRWVDCGLGDSYRTIFDACQTHQSEHVFAWTWVVSPDPAVMALVPEHQRRMLLERLTENLVEEYYEARDENMPSYSYVIHDRDASTGQQQLHTHVVLLGTVQALSGDRPFYNNRKDGHIDLFNQLSEAVFKRELSELDIPWPTSKEMPVAPTLNPDPTVETLNFDSDVPPLAPNIRSLLDQWFGEIT